MTPILHLARYREIAAALAGSSDEIIVASRGVAAAILSERLREAPASAGEATGRVEPGLRAIDDFARAVVNDAGEYPRIAGDAERRLAMRSAAAAIDDPLLHTRGAASMLERSYRDVRDGGQTLRDFEQRVRDTPGLRDSERTRTALRVWTRYEQLVSALQAVDPADVLGRAAELIVSRAADVAPQIVAGFYDMTGAQLRVVSALGAAGRLAAVYVPAGDGGAYDFAAQLLSRLRPLLVPHAPLLPIKAPAVQAVRFQESDAELRAVCSEVRALLDAGVPPARIGITARSLDPDDVRLLGRFSSELGFGVSEQTDVPLLAHRHGRAAAALLRLRERGFPRAEVIDVLRDGFRTERRVDIDELDMATRRARISGGRSADLRNPGNDPRLEDYGAVLAELEALPASPAALIQAATARMRLETELDLAAAAKLDDVTAILQRAGRWKLRFDAETAVDLLAQQSLRPAVPAAAPVVWLGDIMRFRGRTFDHLFVLRMQESLFPQRRIEDPLFPDSDRRRLGMREIGDGRDEERLLFQLLLDGATTAIRFSHSVTDRSGKILRPSPLLKPFGDPLAGTAAGRPITPQSANRERQQFLLAHAGTRSIFDGYLFAVTADDALRAAIAGKLQSVSPTRLEDFGECPQKFLLKHVLGVQDYDDPDRELQLNPRDKGKLGHEILERFYRTVDDSALLRASASFPQLDPELRRRIDALVDEVFDAEEARLPPFNRLMRDIERRTTKRNLHAFLAGDIEDLLERGLRPQHYEYRFGPERPNRAASDHPEPFVLTAHGVPIRVQGSIDRIDGGGGKLRIVDYKSGKALRHTNLAEKIDRGVRLQIALYAMAVAEFFGAALDGVSGAIKPLVVRGTDPQRMSFELRDIEAELRRTLDLFIQSMLEGRFPAFPNEGDDAKSFNSCKYCPVKLACRTRHSTAERRALDAARDARSLLESLA